MAKQIISPALHGENSLDDIVKKLAGALLFVALYSLVAQFIFNGIAFGIKTLLLLVTTSYVAYESEIFCLTHLYDNNNREESKKVLKKTYPIITGLILGLTLPVGTPLWVAAIGSFVAIFLGKMVFGGFTRNIFNPALVGRLFILLAWPTLLGFGLAYSQGDYFLGLLFNVDAVDAVAGATMGASGGFVATSSEFVNLLFGMTHGAIGEVSRFAIIIAMIYLLINKVIDFRIVISILVTTFTMFLLVYSKQDNFVLMALTELFVGGLLLGTTFIATDPVTSPTTKLGRIIFGVGIGVIVVLIRTVGSYPEGVLFAVLFMNMLTPLINDSTMGYHYNKKARVIKIVVSIAIIIGFSLYLGTKI